MLLIKGSMAIKLEQSDYYTSLMIRKIFGHEAFEEIQGRKYFAFLYTSALPLYPCISLLQHAHTYIA